MNKIKLLFLLSGLVGLLSCGKTSMNAELGKSFSMMPDQIVKVDATDLKLEGFELIEDSRCPKGTNCIWEGQIVATFQINDMPIKLNSKSKVTTLGYTFEILSVSPVKTNAEIPLNDYILEVLITK